MIIFKIIRIILYYIWCLFPFKRGLKVNRTITIDIVIPVLEKDLKILPYCLTGLKANVCNNIKDIYIVGPNLSTIKDFAKKHSLIFINENSILGYSAKDINYTTYNGLNRSGWIFQQLIKLSAQIGNSRYFLVIDADHILLKPHIFITDNNKMVFYQSSEFHLPYYKMIKKIIKGNAISLFSYVSHKMIFDKEELNRLHHKIENYNKNKYSWDKIILSSLDLKEGCCFSEFETYGNFINKKRKTLLPWREKTLKRTNLSNYETLKKQYSNYRSVTFPSYLE